MSTTTATIEGFQEWLDIVDPVRATREIDRAVDRASEVLRDAAKTMPPVSKATTGFGEPGIPVSSGRLRQSIAKRKASLFAAEVFVPLNYAGYVHEGANGVPARPYFQWLLKEFEGDQMIMVILNVAIDNILNP